MGHTCALVWARVVDPPNLWKRSLLETKQIVVEELKATRRVHSLTSTKTKYNLNAAPNRWDAYTCTAPGWWPHWIGPGARWVQRTPWWLFILHSGGARRATSWQQTSPNRVRTLRPSMPCARWRNIRERSRAPILESALYQCLLSRAPLTPWPTERRKSSTLLRVWCVYYTPPYMRCGGLHAPLLHYKGARTHPTVPIHTFSHLWCDFS